jgi:hypothetical protein
MSMKAKALVIRQPWAALVVTGAKDVENRTWTTEYRGPLAIIASATRDAHAYDAANATIDGLKGLDLIRWCDATSGLAYDIAIQRGGLVGVVDLVDIVTDHPSPWAMPGLHHWVLANARACSFVPMKGRLGLFEIGEINV